MGKGRGGRRRGEDCKGGRGGDKRRRKGEVRGDRWERNKI